MLNYFYGAHAYKSKLLKRQYEVVKICGDHSSLINSENTMRTTDNGSTDFGHLLLIGSVHCSPVMNSWQSPFEGMIYR